MLTATNKKTINLVVPMVLAGIVIYVVFRWKKSWQLALGAGALGFFISWVITASITKNLATSKPVAIDPYGNGVYTDDYDPTALTDQLYETLTCTFCFRNDAPAQALLNLPSVAFRKVVDAWNSKYYADAGSLSGKIADQYSGGFGWILQSDLADSLKLRFITEGLN